MSGVSVKFWASWVGVPAPRILPPLRVVEPPVTPVFSSTRTLAPASLAVTAADRPAAPAPTTTTSTSKVSSAGALFSTTALFRASASPPALVTHSATACLMALLVTVALVTLSTARDWASTIAGPIVSTGEVFRP